MSNKFILLIIFLFFSLIVGVGVYSFVSGLNPIKENKTTDIGLNTNNVIKSVSKQVNKNSILSSQIVLEIPRSELTVQSIDSKSSLSSSIKNKYTQSELSTHKSETDCYVSVNKKVYNVTAYIGDHPGGTREILRGCGKVLDGVRHPNGGFMGDQVQSVLSNYSIGELN